MPHKYQQLSMEEREKLQWGLWEKKSLRTIAALFVRVVGKGRLEGMRQAIADADVDILKWYEDNGDLLALPVRYLGPTGKLILTRLIEQGGRRGRKAIPGGKAQETTPRRRTDAQADHSSQPKPTKTVLDAASNATDRREGALKYKGLLSTVKWLQLKNVALDP